MSFRIAIALLVLVVGAVVYIVQTPPPERYRYLGLAAFLVGLWWALGSVATHAVGFGP